MKKVFVVSVFVFLFSFVFVSSQEVQYEGAADVSGVWDWAKGTWSKVNPFSDTEWSFGSFFSTLAGYRTAGDLWLTFLYYFVVALGAWGLLFGLHKLSTTARWFNKDNPSLWIRAIAGDLWKVLAYPFAFGVLMATPVVGRILGLGTLIYVLEGLTIAWTVEAISLFFFSMFYLAIIIGVVPQLIYSFYRFRAVAKAKFGDLEARRRGAAIKAYSEGLTKG